MVCGKLGIWAFGFCCWFTGYTIELLMNTMLKIDDQLLDFQTFAIRFYKTVPVRSTDLKYSSCNNIYQSKVEQL